jgi:hypothetical protein
VLREVVAHLRAGRWEDAHRLVQDDHSALGAWLHGRAADLWRISHPHGAGLNPALLPGLLPGAWPAPEDMHDPH